MKSLITIGTALAFGYIWFSIMLFPSLHRILRNIKVYVMFLVFSIALPIASINYYGKEIIDTKKEGDLMSFYLLLYLIMYKYFDNIILKKHNRHLYFHIRNDDFWGETESMESKGIEHFYQFVLILFPAILMYGIEYLFEHL